MIADQRARTLSLLLVAFSGVTLARGGLASAQEITAVPEYTGDRVYVRDVPDQYQSLIPAIKQLERASPQTYFAVVIRSAGQGPNSARNYLHRLWDVWSRQAQSKGLILDPGRSVITLAAIEDRKVAVHVGTELSERFGLTSGKIDDLIGRVFIPLAQEQRYPQAVASLMAFVNNEIARVDPRTAAVSTGTDLFPNPPARVVGSRPGGTSSEPAATASQPGATLGTTGTAAHQAQPTSTGSGWASQRDVILALIGSLVAVGLIIAGLIWLARHRTRNAVDGKIKEFKEKAVDAMDKLDALKERLKRLPKEDPDFKEPMSGATLLFYEETQQHLTGLWDRWLEVMDTLDKAQALAKKDSALGTEKLKEAEKLVSDSKIFEQIEEQSKACAASMDRLNQAHENARAAAETVAASQKEIHEKVEHVAKEGLPTIPYKPEIDAIAAQAEAAGAILTPDPIGARESLEAAQERAVTLRDRVGQILERYAEGRKISAELSNLAEQVAKHRREGLRLDEDGGDPDHPIALTFQTLEGLRKAVHEGDAKTALEQLQQAQAQLKQAQETLEGVLKARQACIKDQPQRVRDTQRLREALEQYEAFEAELKRYFAPESWQAVSGNLAQARLLLETFDRKAEEVTSSAAAQKYLVGAQLLEQLTAEQQAVNQLMLGVGERLSGLKTLRQECQTAAHSLEEQAHATSRFFSQNAQVTGAMAKATLAAAEESRGQINSLLAGPRPDWLRIRQLLARALDEYA
ncbi:MAG: TPM domain-containing protein, partial [Planctomycetaceae bacterium]|nr:TPM domain-containing protein [Planctomycetaceae bacterium]